MDESALIAKMDERARWVDLPGGKRVQFRRPLETDMGSFVGGVSVEHVCAHVCGWQGFTEADLLGAGIGASDGQVHAGALVARRARPHRLRAAGGRRDCAGDPGAPGQHGGCQKLTALLDAQAGVEYEGDDVPVATAEDRLAFKVFGLFANGSGGFDWAGMPLACARYGVRDVAGLIDRLLIIKTHRTDDDRNTQAA